MRRGGAGFCLLCLPPISHFPVLFVSLALWVGIAATCWLSDSWADCPLTVPSPEQKSRRGSPSVCPHLLLLCLWKALALRKTLSASSGEARAAAVFKDCPALQLAAGSGWPGRQRLALALCRSCSPPTGLAPLWSFWKVPSQPPVLGWKHRKDGSPGVARSGHLPWWQRSVLGPSWACSRLFLGALPFPMM